MAYILSPRVQLKEITGQFLVGDIVATIASIVAGVVTQNLTGSVAWAAIAATITEAFFWYLYLYLYYVLGRHDTWGMAWRNLVSDFGLAEALDLFVVRPILMYIFPKLIGNEAGGIFIGKVLSDMIYTWIGLYHQRKRTLPHG